MKRIFYYLIIYLNLNLKFRAKIMTLRFTGQKFILTTPRIQIMNTLESDK